MDEEAGGEGGSGKPPARNKRAVWLFPRCRTLREFRGLRIKTLADLAGLDTSTIENIEKNKGVTIESVYAVFNALNERHGNRLVAEDELTTNPRKRR